MSRRTDTGAVFLTWLSYGNDPYQRKRPDFHEYVKDEHGQHIHGPLYSSLVSPDSPLRNKIDVAYICWRDAPAQRGRISEKEVWQATHETLRIELNKTRISPQPWKTEKSPTDHAAILSFAQGVLERVLQENPGADIYINVSPGTPAMQAAWLLLGATGFGGDRVKLYQGRPAHARDKGEQTLVPVHFEIDTYLRRYQTSQPSSTTLEDSGHLWEPALIQSPAMKEVMEQLQRWAPMRVPLLLLGERGSGKTTLANYLRSIGPFQKLEQEDWPVVVCGQFRIDPGLARAELFGYEKGAFTGATESQPGLLHKADGDCLFLDEITDLDQSTQRMLVAALEGRGFNKLGGKDLNQSTFRLICATNQPQSELHESLDPDFFDRISYVTIRIPPLRQCTEDLPWLWEKVWLRAREVVALPGTFRLEAKAKKSLFKGVKESLLPGNFRDLYRLAYHILARLNGGEGQQSAISSALLELERSRPTSTVQLIPTVEDCCAHLPLKQPFSEIERYFRSHMVEAALRYTNNNTSKAADAIGVERRTFSNWKNKNNL